MTGACRAASCTARSASPSSLLVGLIAASYLADRTLAAFADADAVQHRGHRPPVVVGGALRGRASRPDLHHRQRDPHPGRASRCVIELKSTDVIHSFWVPEPAGKKDLIPGRTTCCSFAPTSPASTAASAPSSAASSTRTWRCWSSPSRARQFDAWRDRAAARPPPARHARRGAAGRRCSSSRGCVMCHRSSGTAAGGTRSRPHASRQPRRRSPPATLPNDAAATWPPGSPTRSGIKPGVQHAGDRAVGRDDSTRSSPTWRG